MGPKFFCCSDMEKFPAHLKGAVVAIGNFDGFHRGHQTVLASLKRIAGTMGRPAIVMTFEPHPREFFARANPLLRLTDTQSKQRLAQALGLDGLVVLTFDEILSQIEPEAFVSDFLVRDLECAAVIVGANFKFGRARRGDVAFLEKAGAEFGFSVQSLDLIQADSEAISSTRVRRSLAVGDVEGANELLGYHWFIQTQLAAYDMTQPRLWEGQVLKTALANTILPGSYAVKVSIGPWPVDGLVTIDTDRPNILHCKLEEPVPLESRSPVTLAFLKRVCTEAGRASTDPFLNRKPVRNPTSLDMHLGCV